MAIKNHFRRTFGASVLAVTLGACGFISPVDSNPNAVSNATVDQLFTGIQVNTFFLATGGLSRIASIWTQQMAGTDRQFVTFDNYTITESDFDDEFEAAYTQGGLTDLRAAISQAEAAGRAAYAGILKVHEAHLVGLLASFYGDIPYSEAVNPAIAQPQLDDQAAVYTAVQALLDEAIVDLGGGGAGPGGVDLNFGGDAARWIAVARTLKARYHMHWAEVNGASSYTSAALEAAAGITSTAGNWRAVFSTSATENNLWYQFERDRSGYISAGDFLVPELNTDADPRGAVYFSGSPPAARASNLSPTGYGAAGYNLPIVTCSENYFILAEAEFQLGSEPNAITAAQDALACQEAQHGVTLTAQSTNIAGLTGQALFDEIMRQKYIALFLSPEVFNDYKRTCRPAIVERANGMPGRLFYAISERQTNENVPGPGTDPNDKYNDNDPTAC